MQDVVLAGSLSLRALALVGCLEDGELVLRKTDGGRRLASGWDALLDRLSRLDRTAWHDLHVWRDKRPSVRFRLEPMTGRHSDGDSRWT
jgi:hypothetical protein